MIALITFYLILIFLILFCNKSYIYAVFGNSMAARVYIYHHHHLIHCSPPYHLGVVLSPSLSLSPSLPPSLPPSARYLSSFCFRSVESVPPRVVTTGRIHSVPSVSDKMCAGLSDLKSLATPHPYGPRKTLQRPVLIRESFTLGM